MRSRSTLLLLCGLTLITLLGLGGCNLGRRAATPTPGLNPTQSYQTAVARVTQIFEETQAALIGEPTASETPETSTPTVTPGAGTPSATPAPPTPTASITPQPCDKAIPGNPIDVTIPDDTKMLPGQQFVKTWRLVNGGTCTWTTQYAVVWVSGAQIGDNDVIFLTGSVGPGQSVDISVPMTAPTATGSYQSNWQLRNASGVLFGIGNEGRSVFWARIEVVQPTATPTRTPTPTLAASATPTATATPGTVANGTANLATGDSVDLDTLQVNPGGGADLSYSVNGGGNHLLTPQNGALLGVYGAAKPTLAQCQAASLGSAPLAVESVGVGIFLCYRTDAGRYGWLQLTTFDPNTGALMITAVTWANP